METDWKVWVKAVLGFLGLSFRPVAWVKVAWEWVGMVVAIGVMLGLLGLGFSQYIWPQPVANPQPQWSYLVVGIPLWLAFLFLVAGVKLKRSLTLLETPRLVCTVQERPEPGGTGSKWVWVKVCNPSAKSIANAIASLTAFRIIEGKQLASLCPGTALYRLPWNEQATENEQWYTLTAITQDDKPAVDLAMIKQDCPDQLVIPANPDPDDETRRPNYSSCVFSPGIYECIVKVNSKTEPFKPTEIGVRITFLGQGIVCAHEISIEQARGIGV